MKTNKMRIVLICGMLGCLCYGGGDWLMLYGNPARHGALSWLTEGVAAMPQWRFSLAMALAFPGIILYGIALFAVQGYITRKKQRRVYHCLNAFGLTPWIALHLFYIMILTLYAWLNQSGFARDAAVICEGLYARLSWLVPASEALMLPVFVYWFWLQISGNTEDVMPLDSIPARWAAFGWEVVEMNGDDMDDIVRTFDAIDYHSRKPHLIVSNTTKGRGVSFMEGVAKWHHGVLDEKQCQQAVEEIDNRIKQLKG